MVDLKRLAPEFRAKHRPLTFIDGTKPAPRGLGVDRRHIIVLDGRDFTRHHKTAARVEAKRIAWETLCVLGELLGVACIVASIVLLAAGLAPG